MVIDYTPYLQCSDPYAHSSVIKAIVKVESGGDPWAININKKGVRLLAKPKTREQAQAWINWFVKNSYNIDIGIAQINIKNIQKMKLNPSDLLDPCLNLKVAGQILLSNYKNSAKQAKNSDDAVRLAISAYNTGNFRSGFDNGYVNKVMIKYYDKNPPNYAINIPNSNTPPITIQESPRNNINNNAKMTTRNVAQKNSNFSNVKVDLWRKYDDNQS